MTTDAPATATSRRRPIATATVALLALFVIPAASSMALTAAAGYEGSPLIGAVIATAGIALMAVLGRWLLAEAAQRPASEDGDPRDSTRLGLALAWTLVLAGIGNSLVTLSTRQTGPRLAEAFTYVGGALLVAAFAVLFVNLSRIPSTRRELARIIDLEASAMTVGWLLFFTWTYAAWKEAFWLPAFNPSSMFLVILVAYGLSKLALTIRYR